MHLDRDILVVGTARTAIGTFGGALRDIPSAHLGAIAVKAALQRGCVSPDAVGHVVMGNVNPTNVNDAYLSRTAAINAGCSSDTTTFDVNLLCGSGLQAIVLAAQSIALFDCDIAIGGGSESVSRALGSVDHVKDILPWERAHMGITAQYVATRYDVTRDEEDQHAASTQQRAKAGIEAGRFKQQIVPVDVRTRNGAALFDTDEYVHGESAADARSKMMSSFVKDSADTAGNFPCIGDGAAAVVLAGSRSVMALGLKPTARLVGYAHVGVQPAYIGLGAVPATRKVLECTGLTVSDLDVIELNVAFPAQACAVIKKLDLDPAKVNPNGSCISLGHAAGATGAIIVTKAIAELHRTGGRYALVTIGIGGGQGIAAIFERWF